MTVSLKDRWLSRLRYNSLIGLVFTEHVHGGNVPLHTDGEGKHVRVSVQLV